MAPPKRIVYVLRSRSHPMRFYTGRTSNIKQRLASHNAGECTATAKYRPWDVDVVVAFRDETRALAFERYLKFGSGCAFAKRHLRPGFKWILVTNGHGAPTHNIALNEPVTSSVKRMA